MSLLTVLRLARWVVSSLATLASGYGLLKQGSIWKTYAQANPGEAAKLDGYVAALVAGQKPLPPVLATATGKGLAQIIQGGYG